MKELLDKLNILKQENDAAILAHYYVNDEVQEIADYIGDSYYLSKIATTIPQKTLVVCGVYFMGESAKILNPDKTVVMPDLDADCPMAHMAQVEKITKLREQIEDLAVVCYINSSAELKANSDVCVTSANAIKIVKNLPEKNIYFIPDQNLAMYIANQVPEKNFIFNEGYCPVHQEIKAGDVIRAKNVYKDALVLAHPECTNEVLLLADYIGSTSAIIEYATNSDKKNFLICSETGIFYKLKNQNPDKNFYPVKENQVCEGMKLVTLKKVINALENKTNEIHITMEQINKAKTPLNRMLELSK